KNIMKGALRGALFRSGLSSSRSHEELKSRQSFVKLAKRLAMPLVVEPDTLEQWHVEGLQRPEVIAVSRRDLSDQRSRFAGPRVDAPEPHAECREWQHHPFFAQCHASVAQLAQAADLIAIRGPVADPYEARLRCRLAPEAELERRGRALRDPPFLPAHG